jgi:hypothetical protein
MHHAGLRVAKHPAENGPGGEARDAIEITKSLMSFHGHTLAQFRTRVKPPFFLFHGL